MTEGPDTPGNVKKSRYLRSCQKLKMPYVMSIGVKTQIILNSPDTWVMTEGSYTLKLGLKVQIP